MQDRTASTQEVLLALRWFTEEQGHQLLSQWVDLPHCPSYLAVAVEQLPQTDSPLDKDSESKQLVLLLDLSARCDA